MVVLEVASPSYPLAFLANKCAQTKSPLSFCASAGLKLVLLANSAAHPRRRAMRVMAMMMVASQHERIRLREAEHKVNSKELIAIIGIRNVCPSRVR